LTVSHAFVSLQLLLTVKEQKPNNSFDTVMAVIAILALIGFVVSLFKIMG